MYAKIEGATAVKFPYTFGDLRKDNPNVSFPKNIGTSLMRAYGMVGVVEGPQPTPEAYQKVQRNALPTRPVLGQDDDGNDIIADYWQIDYTAVDMFADTTEPDEDGNDVTTTKAQHEAAYQASLDAATADVNRAARNQKLAETDFYALSDVTMSDAMTTYRQALRDITGHDNWPNLADGDWPTKP